MLFNSLSFFVFFPVVTLLYFLLPHRFRWGLLLAASSIFYMAFVPEYILILLALILVDYCAGLLLERVEGKRRRYILWTSILSMVLVLVVFKYFNFFNANVASLATFLHWNYSYEALQLLLPIGLSFHTFQSLSYVIEVYYRRQKAERHLGIYALYVMFYPQLVAGPIERPQNLLHQFREVHTVAYDRVKQGLIRMTWGLFKKVVIADRLGVLVDQVYGHSTLYSGWPLIIASVFFAFQLYCDFSGYTDIALGSAQVMGFRLMENFNRPFSATSISDFWRRWHISLSSWFRDYLYFPLALSIGHSSRIRLYLAVLGVFLVTGLWHGANWTFVIWGGLHGVFIVIGLSSKGIREKLVQAVGLAHAPRLRHALQVLTTFALVDFSLIFFRAQSVSDAWYVVTHLFTGLGTSLSSAVSLGLSMKSILLCIILVTGMELFQFWARKGVMFEKFAELPWYLRWGTYYAFLYLILAFGASTSSSFIYFQF